MIHRNAEYGTFQYVVLASLRVAQLMRGCIPRVEQGNHKPTVIAQLEIVAGKVRPEVPPLS